MGNKHPIDRVAVDLRKSLGDAPQIRGKIDNLKSKRLMQRSEQRRLGEPAPRLEIGIFPRGDALT
jgi:hypothetical protein